MASVSNIGLADEIGGYLPHVPGVVEISSLCAYVLLFMVGEQGMWVAWRTINVV